MKRITLIPSLILTTLASTALLAHAQYTAHDLGPGSALGINNAGTIVGLRPVSGGHWYAFSYSGGVMTDLGTLGGTSRAYDINSAGTIVGSYDTISGDNRTFSYSGGQMTDLGLYGHACAINNAGTIAGVGWFSAGGGHYHAFSYSGGVMTDLGTLSENMSSAYAINNAGTIVGWSFIRDGGLVFQHAFSYSGGVMTDLDTLGGIDANSMAMGISDTGTIVGSSDTSAGLHAFSYDGGVMTDLGTLGGTKSEAYGINTAGTIVGYSTISDGTPHAFSYSDGQMTDLASCLSSIGLTGTSYARAINERGDIVGCGFTAGGDQHAFLLTLSRPPVAQCTNVIVSAGHDCVADALVNNGSFDPGGGPITLTQTPPGPYPLGTNEVILTVTNDNGASDSCHATVTVLDTTPPVILSAAASPAVLWPPDHRMATVDVHASVTDNCGSAVWKIIGVRCNEPVQRGGSGQTAPDSIITGEHTLKLRAERSGKGSERVYDITIQATDSSGNRSALRTVTVTVPKDQGRNQR